MSEDVIEKLELDVTECEEATGLENIDAVTEAVQSKIVDSIYSKKLGRHIEIVYFYVEDGDIYDDFDEDTLCLLFSVSDIYEQKLNKTGITLSAMDMLPVMKHWSEFR